MTVRAVCIAGMHRSGTSMTTRLLNLCGVNLGDAGDFMVPDCFNPDGFWERSGIADLNDAILDHFGGAWDSPPSFPARWVDDPGLARRKAAARAILEELGAREPWGWKDPRNSLTYPFWKELVPDLKLVVCLRNPLDVARSLLARNNGSAQHAYHLWSVYNRSILDHSGSEERLVTHYDSYFHDHRRELCRVLGFLGVPATGETLGAASRAIFFSLRHHSATSAETARAVPEDVRETYERLCAEAGPVCAEALSHPPPSRKTPGRMIPTMAASASAADVWEGHPDLATIRSVLVSLEHHEQRLRADGPLTEEALALLHRETKLLFTRQLEALEKALMAGDLRHGALEASLRAADQRCAALEEALRNRAGILSAVRGSFGRMVIAILKQARGRR